MMVVKINNCDLDYLFNFNYHISRHDATLKILYNKYIEEREKSLRVVLIVKKKLFEWNKSI